MIPEIAGALVSGGLNLVGDMVSQNNARSAFKHRYQDTVADMKKAGLNPALAYGQGGGNPQTSDFGDIGSATVEGYQAVASARQAATQRRLTEAQAKLLEAQTDDLKRITANRAKVSDLMPYRELQKNISIEQRAIIDMIERAQREATNASDVRAHLSANELQTIETELAKLTLPQARAAAKYFQTWLGRNQLTIDKALSIIESVTGSIGNLKGGGSRTYNTNNYIPRGR